MLSPSSSAQPLTAPSRNRLPARDTVVAEDHDRHEHQVAARGSDSKMDDQPGPSWPRPGTRSEVLPRARGRGGVPAGPQRRRTGGPWRGGPARTSAGFRCRAPKDAQAGGEGPHDQHIAGHEGDEILPDQQR
jgi:hypothetical protein